MADENFDPKRFKVVEATPADVDFDPTQFRPVGMTPGTVASTVAGAAASGAADIVPSAIGATPEDIIAGTKMSTGERGLRVTEGAIDLAVMAASAAGAEAGARLWAPTLGTASKNVLRRFLTGEVARRTAGTIGTTGVSALAGEEAKRALGTPNAPASFKESLDRTQTLTGMAAGLELGTGAIGGALGLGYRGVAKVAPEMPGGKRYLEAKEIKAAIAPRQAAMAAEESRAIAAQEAENATLDLAAKVKRTTTEELFSSEGKAALTMYEDSVRDKANDILYKIYDMSKARGANRMVDAKGVSGFLMEQGERRFPSKDGGFFGVLSKKDPKLVEMLEGAREGAKATVAKKSVVTPEQMDQIIKANAVGVEGQGKAYEGLASLIQISKAADGQVPLEVMLHARGDLSKLAFRTGDAADSSLDGQLRGLFKDTLKILDAKIDAALPKVLGEDGRTMWNGYKQFWADHKKVFESAVYETFKNDPGKVMAYIAPNRPDSARAVFNVLKETGHPEMIDDVRKLYLEKLMYNKSGQADMAGFFSRWQEQGSTTKAMFEGTDAAREADRVKALVDEYQKQVGGRIPLSVKHRAARDKFAEEIQALSAKAAAVGEAPAFGAGWLSWAARRSGWAIGGAAGGALATGGASIPAALAGAGVAEFGANALPRLILEAADSPVATTRLMRAMKAIERGDASAVSQGVRGVAGALKLGETVGTAIQD